MIKQSEHRYSLFLWSLIFGFISIFMPWTMTKLNVRYFDQELGLSTLQPLTFWQTSLLTLFFKGMYCRDWIVSQSNTAQGKFLTIIQWGGFITIFVIVTMWAVFFWMNRNDLPEKWSARFSTLGVSLVFVGWFLFWRLLTNTNCTLIQSLELGDTKFFWTSVLFPIFSLLYGISAIVKSLKKNL